MNSTGVLFGRVAQVVVGAAGQQGTIIESLRISFNVKKTATPESNTCEVAVYNLGAGTRNKFKEDDVLVLRAGYREAHGLEQLAITEVLTVDNTVEPPDVVTTFVCKDGARVLRTNRLAVSFKAGSSVRQVLQDVVKSFGIDQKVAFETLQFTDLPLENGYAFSGYAKDAMDTLCGYVGLTWSIQDGALKIVPSDGADGTQAFRLTPQTGLIGSPKRIRKMDKTSTSKDEAFTGWEVTALLLPRAEPKGIIELETEFVSKAQFQIVEVEHIGDTHDGDYRTVLKVRE